MLQYGEQERKRKLFRYKVCKRKMFRYDTGNRCEKEKCFDMI